MVETIILVETHAQKFQLFFLVSSKLFSQLVILKESKVLILDSQNYSDFSSLSISCHWFLFLTPKSPENQRSPDIFRRYRKRSLAGKDLKDAFT